MKYWLICALVAISACRKQTVQTDCSALAEAIISFNEPALIEQVQRAANKTGKLPEPTDFQTVENRLQQIATDLSSSCGVQAKLHCTQCIYTLPAQSEIMLSSGGSSIVIDLQTEDGKNIKVINAH